MTEKSAFSAVRRGSRRLGRWRPRAAAGPPARSARPASPRRARGNRCAAPSGGARRGLDLRLHQPLGGKGQHLAHEIRAGPLLHELGNDHPPVGLVVLPVRVRVRHPEPVPKIGHGRPRGDAISPLHHSVECYPVRATLHAHAPPAPHPATAQGARDPRGCADASEGTDLDRRRHVGIEGTSSSGARHGPASLSPHRAGQRASPAPRHRGRDRPRAPRRPGGRHPRSSNRALRAHPPDARPPAPA